MRNLHRKINQQKLIQKTGNRVAISAYEAIVLLLTKWWCSQNTGNYHKKRLSQSNPIGKDLLRRQSDQKIENAAQTCLNSNQYTTGRKPQTCNSAKETRIPIGKSEP